MSPYIWIGLGSGLGGMARYWCSLAVAARWGEAFPWGTLAVNVLGCGLIGVLAAMGDSEARWYLPVAAREFLIIGVMGGYTTFSSFSLQTLMLMRNGEWLLAGAYVMSSVFVCLLATWLGSTVMHWLQLRGR